MSCGQTKERGGICEKMERFQGQKRYNKELCDNGFAKRSGEFSGAICLKPLFCWDCPIGDWQPDLVNKSAESNSHDFNILSQHQVL